MCMCAHAHTHTYIDMHTHTHTHATYLSFLNLCPDLGIASMLFAHKMFILSLRSITNNKKCPTDLTHLHLLQLGQVLSDALLKTYIIPSLLLN